jgi:putative transposase
VRVIKAVKQSYQPAPEVRALLEDFRLMVNDCIRVGLKFEEENHVTPSMRKLSLLCYGQLKKYHVYSAYRLTAITKAAGILSARRKSIKRGYHAKSPYVSKPLLVSCYHLKIQDGKLRVQLGDKRCEYVPLNPHTLRALSETTQRVNSFTLTGVSLSLCVSKEVMRAEPRELTGTVGIDRNLRNLTVGNAEKVTYYDMTKVVEIADNTKSIVRSFKRNDVRIRQSVSSKYGTRRSERTKQVIHGVTKQIVQQAKTNKQAIVFEEVRGIRNLYRRGNGQRKSFRGRMNSWPFHEVKRQVEYKAAWEGVPVVTLSRSDTRGTTMDCARCGERLQSPVRGDLGHHRQLWCGRCGRWMDRDLVAVLNISRRGWVRFARSSKEGEAGEAMRGNAEHDGEPLILRVDASKLHRAHGRSRTLASPKK